MATLFDEYAANGAYDEMFDRAGRPRKAYRSIHKALGPMAGDDLRARADLLAEAFRDEGVTFAHDGEDVPFPLDLVPRVIGAKDWAKVSRGVTQRVQALEAFLADIYGPGQVFEDGVVPRRVVATSPHFHREAAGFDPPNGVRIHVAGIDLIRDDEGRWVVLEDNLRSPSGVSYVISNRHTMSRVFPELFASHHIQPVNDYPAHLLDALVRAAPSGVIDPRVVVLTPGVYNAAYFEHALLARQMGVELVEGRDLYCVGNRVLMRTTEGDRPVHVIYRRVDDEFLDPLQFRHDSALGCPGLINAARAGSVTIANAVGNGVADDKLLYTWVPDLIRYYLQEEPILANAATHRLDDPGVLEWVLDCLDTLVLKPVDGSGGKGLVIGPKADKRTLTQLKRQVRANPRGWIAQPVITLSTSPTLIDDDVQPRHVDLRPFAVNDGENVWVMPGGLTRVALPEGELVVNSSQGGGSKDTWVLTDGPTVAEPEPERQLVAAGPPPGVGPRPDPGPPAAFADQQQQ